MFFDYLVLGASDTAGLNILDILATLFFFVLLMFLLKKVAWGPLMGIMTQREELVAGEIESAETSRKESQRLLEEQRALLKEARTEAIAIVENAKKQGEKSREEVITAARSEASILKESAIRDIDAEKERAIAAVRSEVVSLSVLAASKILEKEVSEEDNRALIEATIAKAGEAN